MGVTHCPLCVGLAVLSAVRFSAHALLIWNVRRSPTRPASQQGSLPRLQPQAI
ncbi:hypothetical protein KBY66_04020 [Synechococcus sp. Tobar12-5m-g]|uniref:hypothetical protein n=1 Tax=Synechococcus sp. Cruz CV-v-12 TaxID=2823728 RepID=UPI0020CE7556|nr:hypothetical protein [Synechococcus sp. Cruz CV-v-12]MCP9771794.1 hypothetical protein [Synechococcus sp. Tobar12-5m-g]MCP9872736.1 hypothetical protein [Synechococcus sp. Cruz CV-v-12]